MAEVEATMVDEEEAIGAVVAGARAAVEEEAVVPEAFCCSKSVAMDEARNNTQRTTPAEPTTHLSYRGNISANTPATPSL